MALTEEDKNMIVYFIKEKGDITRWCSWESKKQEIEEEFPELINALKQLEIAERTLNAIVNAIEETIY